MNYFQLSFGFLFISKYTYLSDDFRALSIKNFE